MAELEKPTAVLVERARQLAIEVGYDDPPADSVYGFWLNQEYLDRLFEEQGGRVPLSSLDGEQLLRFCIRRMTYRACCERCCAATVA